MTMAAFSKALSSSVDTTITPRLNKDVFSPDGFFKAGNVAYFKNGMSYIVDGKKEPIKYKGIQVAPAELEALLRSHL